MDLETFQEIVPAPTGRLICTTLPTPPDSIRNNPFNCYGSLNLLTKDPLNTAAFMENKQLHGLDLGQKYQAVMVSNELRQLVMSYLIVKMINHQLETHEALERGELQTDVAFIARNRAHKIQCRLFKRCLTGKGHYFMSGSAVYNHFEKSRTTADIQAILTSRIGIQRKLHGETLKTSIVFSKELFISYNVLQTFYESKPFQVARFNLRIRKQSSMEKEADYMNGKVSLNLITRFWINPPFILSPFYSKSMVGSKVLEVNLNANYSGNSKK